MDALNSDNSDDGVDHHSKKRDKKHEHKHRDDKREKDHTVKSKYRNTDRVDQIDIQNFEDQHGSV